MRRCWPRPARRTANGAPMAATLAIPDTRRSIRSTPPTSTSLKLAWRFKTDNLGPRPEYNLEGTPLMVNGVVYTTAGSRRDVVALDAATGEMLWMHTENEGARGAAAPRQLSGRGLAYWTDGKTEERILYVTPGYRLIALDAKTGTPVPSFGKAGVVDLKLDDDQDHRSDHRRNRTARRAHGRGRRDHRRRRASGWRRAKEQDQRQRLRPRLRRAHRQAPVDFPHHPAARRVRLRHMGKRLRRIYRQHRRLGPDQRGRGSRHGLFAGGTAHRRLLRRPSSRQRTVRRKHRCRRSENRPAQMALPAGASRHVGHGHSLRSDAGGHHRERPARKGSRPADQAGDALCVRSSHRPAHLAHRRKTRAQRRRARRMVFAHPADSDQAPGLRAQRLLGGRPDRFHSGAESSGPADHFEVQNRAALHAPGGRQTRRPAGYSRYWLLPGRQLAVDRTIRRPTSSMCMARPR